jgi:hypothetical protein
LPRARTVGPPLSEIRPPPSSSNRGEHIYGFLAWAEPETAQGAGDPNGQNRRLPLF